MRGHRLEFADRPDEPERRGGQAQLVGGQPAQALPVGGQPDGARAGHQFDGFALGAGGERLEGSNGDRRRWRSPRSPVAAGRSPPRASVSVISRTAPGRLPAPARPGAHRPSLRRGAARHRQLPAELAGTQQQHAGLVLSFGQAVGHQLRIGAPQMGPARHGWPGNNRTISPVPSASTVSSRRPIRRRRTPCGPRCW